MVKALEDKFGVSAAAAASSSVAVGWRGRGPGRREKDTFDVILMAAGANKINVIKVVRELPASD